MGPGVVHVRVAVVACVVMHGGGGGGGETVAPASVRRALGVPWGGWSSGGGPRTLWRSRQRHPTLLRAPLLG